MALAAVPTFASQFNAATQRVLATGVVKLYLVEVPNLVVFPVTIGAHLMAFTECIAKAV